MCSMKKDELSFSSAFKRLLSGTSPEVVESYGSRCVALTEGPITVSTTMFQTWTVMNRRFSTLTGRPPLSVIRLNGPRQRVTSAGSPLLEAVTVRQLPNSAIRGC